MHGKPVSECHGHAGGAGGSESPEQPSQEKPAGGKSHSCDMGHNPLRRDPAEQPQQGKQTEDTARRHDDKHQGGLGKTHATRPPAAAGIQAMGRCSILPAYHSTEESATGSRSSGPSNSWNPESRRACTRPEAGSIAAMRIQRLVTICFSDALRSITPFRRSGVVSITKRMRTGSWIE